MTHKMPGNPPAYGGQAVIEGVLMRGRRSCAIAVRAPDHKIIVRTEELGGLYRSRLAGLPFIRGLLVLWDALVLGVRALTFSANVQAEAEGERTEGFSLFLTLGVSMLLGIAFFFLLPAGAAHLLGGLFAWPAWGVNLLEGAVRLLLLVAYVGLIGLLPDIRRVYAYHGAEHKTINAYEAGAPITVESVRPFTTLHPRCGTGFLLVVVVIS